MPLPTFFLVGAPKAGTTSLYHYLREHPHVFMSQEKEPHYFSFVGEQQPPWGTPTLDAYKALFADAGGSRAVGEASTWYLYSTAASREIHAEVPDARILMLLRNPVDRAFSSWAYGVQMSWEKEDFETALAKEADRTAAGGAWDVHYVQAGMYAAQVRRYLDMFPRSQIGVWTFEDFRRDPSRVCREAYEFIGVDPRAGFPDTRAVHNPTARPRWPALNRALRRPGRLKAVAKAVLPTGLRQTIARSLRSSNQAAKPSMDPAVRSRLREVYRQDVAELSDLLATDFESAWFGDLPPSPS